MPDLADSLRQAKDLLDRYQSQGSTLGEANTKAGLIEPILEGLGWDTHDPDEVCREYHRLPQDKPVDYALLLLRTPKLLVEAKGTGECLDDPKWANQIVAYATAAGVEWVVLTNGAEWRIYNSCAPVPFEEKLFKVARLRDVDELDEAGAVLQLLAKDNMSDNQIEELWRAYFVDRQVHECLQELFDGEPAKELVSAVHQRRSNLTLREIRASLTRARAIFDFPTVSDSAHIRPPAGKGGPTGGPQLSRVAAGGASSDAVTSAERKTTLADLLAHGLLTAGATLEGAAPGGQTAVATVRTDGWIDVAGVAYKTPSGAGSAAKEHFAGHPLAASQKATDGWTFWRAKDTTGELVTLKELRRRAGEAAQS